MRLSIQLTLLMMWNKIDIKCSNTSSEAYRGWYERKNVFLVHFITMAAFEFQTNLLLSQTLNRTKVKESSPTANAKPTTWAFCGRGQKVSSLLKVCWRLVGCGLFETFSHFYLYSFVALFCCSHFNFAQIREAENICLYLLCNSFLQLCGYFFFFCVQFTGIFCLCKFFYSFYLFPVFLTQKKWKAKMRLRKIIYLCTDFTKSSANYEFANYKYYLYCKIKSLKQTMKNMDWKFGTEKTFYNFYAQKIWNEKFTETKI